MAITRTGRHRLLRQSFIAPLVFALLLVAGWELAQPWLGLSRMVLVPPSVIATTLFSNMPILGPHVLSTAWETALGFVLAAITGITLGTVITLSPRVREAIYPNIVLLQLIPKIALAPVFLVWFGVGSPTRLAFAVFMAFFPIAISTATGLVRVKQDSIRLCRSLTASNWQTFLHVRFPFAIPSIFSGLKVGMTMALIGIIVGEFVTAQEGLGYVVLFASSAGAANVLYAALVLICAVGLVLYATVVMAETMARRWYGAPFAGGDF
jgi:NitT/TauT family transport system permease protein